MRRCPKTVTLLAAAVVYVPLVIDWLMPGNGLHQATVALGGYGPDALRPFSGYCLWDSLVRQIGWDLRGLGTLSMFGALVTLGLVASLAERAARGVSFLSAGLLCAAFVVTPGFLRAATRPDPLMTLLAVPLAGLASLAWGLAKSRHETTARKRRRKWCLTAGSLLLAYGLLSFISLEFSALAEDSLHLLWFAALGVLPRLFLAQRMRRRTVSRRFRAWFFGLWIAAIAISANVAVKSFNVGRASGRLAEQLIANAGGDPSIAADPALADIYLWTLPPDRRTAVMAAPPKDALPVERYLPTADLWHVGLSGFVAMKGGEPHQEYYQGLFRACGNSLGKRLLDAGDLHGAWTVLWEVLDGVDGEDDETILGLCELIERGYDADAASWERFSRRFLRLFRGLKMSERLTEAETKTAKTVQRTIQACISRRLVRPDLIGRGLLDLDLLLGDWESAERDALGILASDRQHVQALAVMGRVCSRRGDYPEAESHLRRALDTGRADARVTSDLAFVLVRMGYAKNAVPLAQSPVRSEPGNWSFRETLALALIRSGNPKEGEQELRAAANLARNAKVPPQDLVRLAVDRAWLFKGQGDEKNLKNTLRVLKKLKGLERGLQMEIEEIED